MKKMGKIDEKVEIEEKRKKEGLGIWEKNKKRLKKWIWILKRNLMKKRKVKRIKIRGIEFGRGFGDRWKVEMLGKRRNIGGGSENLRC